VARPPLVSALSASTRPVGCADATGTCSNGVCVQKCDGQQCSSTECQEFECEATTGQVRCQPQQGR